MSCTTRFTDYQLRGGKRYFMIWLNVLNVIARERRLLKKVYYSLHEEQELYNIATKSLTIRDLCMKMYPTSVFLRLQLCLFVLQF